jgi:predicted homoserine dehydrogenase-like protein
MREIYAALRNSKGQVNVAVVGCGWWGAGVARALAKKEFMRPRVLVDKDIDRCAAIYSDLGISRGDILQVNQIKDLQKADRYSYLAMSDLNFLEELSHLNVDIVHESTGRILAGARVALLSLENKIPFTTINSEMDATIGMVLFRKAAEKGTVYTNTEGDQPGCLAAMLDTVINWGFEPRIVGNCKLFLDHYQTPEGVMPWVPKGGNPYSYCGAADGSKLSLEMSVVANAFNFPPMKRGMYGPDTKKNEIIKTFDHLLDLDNLSSGHIDYTLGSTEKNMGGPIFIIAHTREKHLRAEMKNYKMGSGPYYLFFRDYHLGSMEAPLTIARVALFGKMFLSPVTWCSEVLTFAKRDLKTGTKLDSIGGYDYYGLVEKAEIASREKLLPIGLAEFATLTRSFKKDEVITYDSVEIEDNIAVRLRKVQDSYQ